MLLQSGSTIETSRLITASIVVKIELAAITAPPEQKQANEGTLHDVPPEKTGYGSKDTKGAPSVTLDLSQESSVRSRVPLP